jgi:hypothetical protein
MYRLQLKFHDFVRNKFEDAERQVTCVSHVSDIPVRNMFPDETTEALKKILNFFGKLKVFFTLQLQLNWRW